jgi:hypothetical protein
MASCILVSGILAAGMIWLGPETRGRFLGRSPIQGATTFFAYTGDRLWDSRPFLCLAKPFCAEISLEPANHLRLLGFSEPDFAGFARHSKLWQPPKTGIAAPWPERNSRRL